MVVRYAVTRSHPIPIVFHWVLAAFLFTLGRSMRPKRAGAMATVGGGSRGVGRGDRAVQ